jgi:hypothetical protein
VKTYVASSSTDITASGSRATRRTSPLPATAGPPHAQGQGRHQRHDHRVLPRPVQQRRREQPVEQAAECAANRHEQVEAGQVLHVRPGRGQPPVRGQPGQGEQQQVEQHRRPDRRVDHADQSEHHREHDRGREQRGRPRQAPAAPAEGDDEGRQVDGERHRPEQRDRRDVGRDVGRHPEHQARRHEGHRDPAQAGAQGGRRVA